MLVVIVPIWIKTINIHPKSELYVRFHFLLISSTSACYFSRLALLCSRVKLSTRFISLTKRSASLPTRIGGSLIGLAIFISSYYFDVCIFLWLSLGVYRLLLKQVVHCYFALYHAVLGIFCHSVSRNEGEVQSFVGASGFSEQLTAIDDMFQIGRDS